VSAPDAAPSVGDRLCALSGESLPGFSWLDGGDTPGARGLVAAWPDVEIVGDSLDRLDEVEQRWRAEPDAVWMGWLSYELGAADQLQRSVRHSALPPLCMRQYRGGLRLLGGEIASEFGDAARLRSALADVEPLAADAAWPLEPLTAGLDPAAYRGRVRAAQERIAAGDTYQVNLSQPMSARWTAAARRVGEAERAAMLYAALRRRCPGTMGGLVSTPVGTIVSNSPETLLETTPGAGHEGGVLARSWPIKGTRPRGEGAADAALADALRASAKDAAEHVMIVDLVRNDLGRLAAPGQVFAPPKPSLLSLPTVHHLVTEVRATLRDDVGLTELVRALFPAGSITGAPKRSTVGIIDTLEEHTRGIYCGSLLVLQPSGVTLNIAIRTALAHSEGITMCSGGGIVIDSDPEAERLETLDKAAAFGGP